MILYANICNFMIYTREPFRDFLFYNCRKNSICRGSDYRVNASDRIAGPMLIAAAFCHVVMAPRVYTIKTPRETRTGPQLVNQAL